MFVSSRRLLRIVVGSSSGFALCFFRSWRSDSALDARSSSLAERKASLSEADIATTAE
jgi:hypothetical protein